MAIKKAIGSAINPPGEEGGGNVRLGEGRAIALPPNVTMEDLYRTSTLLGVMHQLTEVNSFLRDTFFSLTRTTLADIVQIDYVKGNQKLAPWVAQMSKGSTVIRDRYRTSVFKPQKLAPIKALTSADLFYRNPGTMDVTKAAELVMLDLIDLNKRITRTENWLISQYFFNRGTIRIEDFDTGNLLSTITYAPITETAVDIPWTDTVNSNPLGNLRAAVRGVSSAAGAQADIIVMGSLASELFESSDAVMKAFDKRFIIQGLIQPEYKDYGVTVVGNWRNIPIFADETTYEDSKGASIPYVPPNAVLIGCSANQSVMSYAGISQSDDEEKTLVVYEGERIAKIWLPDHVDQMMVRLSSRPVPVPCDPSNFTIMYIDQ